MSTSRYESNNCRVNENAELVECSIFTPLDLIIILALALLLHSISHQETSVKDSIEYLDPRDCNIIIKTLKLSPCLAFLLFAEIYLSDLKKDFSPNARIKEI